MNDKQKIEIIHKANEQHKKAVTNKKTIDKDCTDAVARAEAAMFAAIDFSIPTLADDRVYRQKLENIETFKQEFVDEKMRCLELRNNAKQHLLATSSVFQKSLNNLMQEEFNFDYDPKTGEVFDTGNEKRN